MQFQGVSSTVGIIIRDDRHSLDERRNDFGHDGKREAPAAHTPGPSASATESASSIPSVTARPRRSFVAPSTIGEPVEYPSMIFAGLSASSTLPRPSGRRRVRCTPVTAASAICDDARLDLVRQSESGDHGRPVFASRGQKAEGRRQCSSDASFAAQVAFGDRPDDRQPLRPQPPSFSQAFLSQCTGVLGCLSAGLRDLRLVGRLAVAIERGTLLTTPRAVIAGK